MTKRTTILPLFLLALLAGCGKEEPMPAPATEPAMPEQAPMEVPAAPEAAMPETAPAMPETAPAEAPAAMEETAPVEATPAPESAAPDAAPAEPAVAPESAAPTVQSTAMGKKVYEGLCFSCHAAGIAGAPKAGDKAAWAPRIAQGMDTLYAHSITGFQGQGGVMPPKGGNPGLSDDEVKAAVDHMLSLLP